MGAKLRLPKKMLTNKEKLMVLVFASFVAIVAILVPIIISLAGGSPKEEKPAGATYSVSVVTGVTGVEDYNIKVNSGTTIKDVKSNVDSILGYHFEGLFKDVTLTVAYNDTDKVEENITAYAKFDFMYEVIEAGTGYGIRGLKTKYVGTDELTLPSEYNGKKITRIENNAFQLNNFLKKVVVPDSISVICERAFLLCGNLEEIVFPENLQIIQEAAFSGCSSLKEIKLSKQLQVVGRSIFAGCGSLKSIIVADDNEYFTSKDGSGNQINALIEKSSGILIRGCDSSSIASDGSVKSLGNSALDNIAGLTSIVISEQISSIGSAAFDNCRNLASVTIESAAIYNAASGVNTAEHAGGLLANATEVRVLKTIVDADGNTNSYLNNDANFTITESSDGNYVIYTKKS